MFGGKKRVKNSNSGGGVKSHLLYLQYWSQPVGGAVAYAAQHVELPDASLLKQRPLIMVLHLVMYLYFFCSDSDIESYYID